MGTRKVHHKKLGSLKTACGLKTNNVSSTVLRGKTVTCYNCARWLPGHPPVKRQKFCY